MKIESFASLTEKNKEGITSAAKEAGATAVQLVRHHSDGGTDTLVCVWELVEDEGQHLFNYDLKADVVF